LPMVTFKLWVEMFFLWKADAQIGDELPGSRHNEGAADFVRVEDRYPAGADALRPRGEPKGVNRGDHRIIERVRPGLVPKAETCLRRMIAEDSKVNRRITQSREFEAGIERGALAFIGFERGRVAGIEIRDHRPTRRL